MVGRAWDKPTRYRLSIYTDNGRFLENRKALRTVADSLNAPTVNSMIGLGAPYS